MNLPWSEMKGAKPTYGGRKEGDSDLIASMKETMSIDLHGRYDAEEAKLCMISALDPRFKNLGFLSEEKRYGVYSAITEKAATTAETNRACRESRARPTRFSRIPGHASC